MPPPQGIDELIAAFDAHLAGIDLGERRLRARRANALSDYVHEHGDRGLRALGGRRAAERLLAEQEPALDTAALVTALEQGAAAG
jgi:LAO/AO transport system kinase